ncbi:type III secretion system translocon subunit SctE [Mesorhizobium sp. ANAO-SY3R2]|uniref:type III secretion system translocon subunit SctE n=1 Tax=Mesorhizobium sp. ANAO-SY3R2 TaxID=3166644 RepID=UPI0036720C34
MGLGNSIMSTIGISQVIPNTTDLSNINGTQDPRASATGKGALANGIVPPSDNGGEKPDLAKALKSLAAFMTGTGSVDTEVLLVQVAVAMRDTEATTQKSKINTDQETKKAQMKEKEAKLEESAKKLEKAQNGSIWDKIKLAFEWLGALIAAAVAAVLIATGVGTAVGVLLLAAAVTALVMAIDSTITAATGLGIAGNIAKAAGASEEQIAKADMGFKIGVAVLGVVFAVAAGGAGVGSAMSSAVGAGARAGETAYKAGESIAHMAKSIASAAKQGFSASMQASASTLGQSAQLAQNAAGVTQAVTTAGTATVGVAATVAKSEATTLRAEAKRLEAQAKVNEAFMQALDDMIDQALSRLQASSERFNAILDEITSAMNDRSNTLSRARFAG